MLDVLTYRLYRLRRLIAFAILPPVATVLAMAGPDSTVLLAFAVVLPVLHVLSYPTAWTETIAVSLIIAALLALATTIDPGLGAEHVVTRIGLLIVLGLILFFVLAPPIDWLLLQGPVRNVILRTVAWSSLDTDTLRRTITLRPGREDEHISCSDADAEGVFEVTTRWTCQSLALDVDEDDIELDESWRTGMVQSTFRARTGETSADHHEVYSFAERDGPVCCSRHDFRPCKGGTQIEFREAGNPMTAGYRIGFWLTDFTADYLVAEIDMAEGRAPRANRTMMNRLLIVDLANLFLPMLGKQELKPPR